MQWRFDDPLQIVRGSAARSARPHRVSGSDRFAHGLAMFPAASRLARVRCRALTPGARANLFDRALYLSYNDYVVTSRGVYNASNQIEK